MNLFISFLFGFAFVNSSEVPPIKIIPVYTSEFDALQSSFVFYYGNTEEEDSFESSLNLFYDESIFLAKTDEFSNGIKCITSNDCFKTGYQENIYDPVHLTLLPTEVISMNMRFPLLNDHYSQRNIHFRTHLYSGKKLKNSVISLKPKSNFWIFLCEKYQTSLIKLVIESDLKFKNKEYIIDHPKSVTTEFTFFQSFGSAELHGDIARFDLTTEIQVDNMFLSLQKTNLVFQTTFNFEEPYIFLVSPIKFAMFKSIVSAIICPDPNVCLKQSDLYGNIPNREKLIFDFPKEKMSSQNLKFKESLAFSFRIEELFYVDKHSQIQFNFGISKRFSGGKDQEISIEMGLIFLNKCRLALSYSEITQKMTLKIAPRLMTMTRLILDFWIYLSILVSFLIVCFIIFLTKPLDNKSFRTSWTESFLSNQNFDEIDAELEGKEKNIDKN